MEQKSMYHALIDEAYLENHEILNQFRVLRSFQHLGRKFQILLVTEPEEIIQKIQPSLIANKPAFFHIYNNGISLKIVFKDAIFSVNPNNKNTWIPAQRHGKMIGHSSNELDFFPTRIKEEERL